MPPQTNTKLCLFAFAMLLGTCASSSAQTTCEDYGSYAPGYGPCRQLSRSMPMPPQMVLPQTVQPQRVEAQKAEPQSVEPKREAPARSGTASLPSALAGAPDPPPRRLIENKPFQFGCPRNPC
jgi:hypothetical protein